MPDMKIIAKWLAAFAVFVFLYPATILSAPYDVTFFPDSAYVHEFVKVKLQAENRDMRKAILTLPGQADPDSLVARLSPETKMKIEDITWRQVVRQDDAKIASLRKQLARLKEDKKALQAIIRSLDVQIQFWQLQTKAKVKTISDAYNMSAAIGKNVRKSYQDKLSQESELENLDKKIKNVQEEIDRAAGKKESAWEVVIFLSGPLNKEATLTYSYSLTGCGWQPLYRLEAKPQTKQINFIWEAEIWQGSGQDWNNVNINLATFKPPKTTAPADLQPWIIKPRPLFRADGVRKKAKKGASGDRGEYLAAAAEAPAAPREIKQSTYSVWQIGRKNVPAGSKQKVNIQDEAWPASFIYLARPSQDNQAFVRASVKLAESKDIPPGSSLFVIDGALLGKREFSLFGNEADIFFGVDPLVTVSTKLLSKKSGEKTFLQDKQTYNWERQIDIHNSRTSPVKILIEEPNPQPQDERISVFLTNNPEPAGKTPSLLIWDLDIRASEKKSIFTSVRMEAPKDMVLDLGWRQ